MKSSPDEPSYSAESRSQNPGFYGNRESCLTRQAAHVFWGVFFLSLWFFVLFNLLSDTCLRCDVLRKEGKLLQKKKHERRENRRMPNNFRAHQTTCLIILICEECKNKVLNLPKRQIRQFVVTMACICTLFRLVSVAENIFQMYSTELFQKISISFHFLLLYNCWHCCI